MQAKQEKFCRELNKINFKFDTAVLDLPEGKNVNEEYLHEEQNNELDSTEESMGKDLDHIFDIMNNQATIALGNVSVVVAHSWNTQVGKFEWSIESSLKYLQNNINS